MSRHQYDTTYSSSCSYATLAQYNQGSPGMRPALTSGAEMGVQIVPAYGAAGYNTLTHGGATPSCSGFFSIGDAYKSGSDGACNQQYVRRLCQ